MLALARKFTLAAALATWLPAPGAALYTDAFRFSRDTEGAFVVPYTFFEGEDLGVVLGGGFSGQQSVLSAETKARFVTEMRRLEELSGGVIRFAPIESDLGLEAVESRIEALGVDHSYGSDGEQVAKYAVSIAQPSGTWDETYAESYDVGNCKLAGGFFNFRVRIVVDEECTEDMRFIRRALILALGGHYETADPSANQYITDVAAESQMVEGYTRSLLFDGFGQRLDAGREFGFQSLMMPGPREYVREGAEFADVVSYKLKPGATDLAAADLGSDDFTAHDIELVRLLYHCLDGVKVRSTHCSPDCPCRADEGTCSADTDCEDGLFCAAGTATCSDGSGADAGGAALSLAEILALVSGILLIVAGVARCFCLSRTES